MSNISIFGQIIKKLDRPVFKNLVKEQETDKYQKGFDSWSHLVSMLFCHFAKSQSLRDISNGLRSATGNLNHLGNVHPPSKSNLSYQNKNRSWELFRNYYYALQKQLGQHPGLKQVKFRIKAKIFLLDASTIGGPGIFNTVHLRSLTLLDELLNPNHPALNTYLPRDLLFNHGSLSSRVLP